MLNKFLNLFKSILKNYKATRDWSTSLFTNMSKEELLRTGNANGYDISINSPLFNCRPQLASPRNIKV